MRLPTVLDQQDRRVIGMALVIAVMVVLILVGGAGALGLALRVFLLASGLGG